ncbi:MAG TPA: adenylate/guanylate cyclase domain-containing protein [Acidimicrobiia bacterium]|nr:adenylate/guanylate cyclase domain-containing protein [Acidimicrobiia bacterium]
MELTRAQLQAETGATPEELDQLLGLGIITPEPGGKLTWGDAHRVRTVRSFLAAGVTLDHLERALEEGLLDLGPIADFFLTPSPSSGRTYAEFADEMGELKSLLPRVYENLGLVEPPPKRPLRADEEELIAELVTGWSRIGPERVVERAARLAGDGVRRTVEGWMGLWVELMGSGVEPGRAREETAELGTRLTSLLPRLLVWLEQRLLEQTFNAVNADLFERELAARGWIPPAPPDPPAVVFIDVSGFTQLTEERGDSAALEVGEVLHDRVTEVGRRTGGRLIKLLGDGAMVAFPDAAGAVDASLDVVGSHDRWPQHLPPTRAGIEAGTLIEQDGDLFGRTVNLAARLCGAAGPGEVLVGPGVAGRLSSESTWKFDPVGPLDLKGLAAPVAGYLVSRPPA